MRALTAASRIELCGSSLELIGDTLVLRAARGQLGLSGLAFAHLALPLARGGSLVVPVLAIVLVLLVGAVREAQG